MDLVRHGPCVRIIIDVFMAQESGGCCAALFLPAFRVRRIKATFTALRFSFPSAREGSAVFIVLWGTSALGVYPSGYMSERLT